jgi:hypothetical protein
MSKWDSLLSGGSTPEMAEVVKVVDSTNAKDFGFVPLAMIVIFVVVFAVFVATSNSSSQRTDTVAQEVGVVIKKNVEPEIAQLEKPEKLVKAKFSGKQMFADNDEDYSPEFNDYAKTLESGREIFGSERPVSENSRLMQQQLAPMREALKKSGKSLNQFMAENDAYVPDSLIEAWDTNVTHHDTQSHHILDDEERIIARDAFQTIPMKANVDEAVTILRDVLASRTEADKRGLKLPEMPQDQMQSIKFWSTQPGPASKIAQSILQKI